MKGVCTHGSTTLTSTDLSTKHQAEFCADEAVSHTVYSLLLLSTIASLLYLLVQFRFALLNVAALEAPLILKLDEGLFGDDCIFIANDWHGALVPVYLAAKYRPHGVYQQARSILAVHNLRHQVHASCLTLHASSAVAALLHCPCCSIAAKLWLPTLSVVTLMQLTVLEFVPDNAGGKQCPF